MIRWKGPIERVSNFVSCSFSGSFNVIFEPWENDENPYFIGLVVFQLSIAIFVQVKENAPDAVSILFAYFVERLVHGMHPHIECTGECGAAIT